jgi:hypothetical protein
MQALFGLRMLNFMEYFIGDILSDVSQQIYFASYHDTWLTLYHMTHFRRKLAIFLVNLELIDDIRKRDFEDKKDTNLMDCMIVDRPSNKLLLLIW